MEGKGGNSQVKISREKLSQVLTSCSDENRASLEDIKPQAQKPASKRASKDGFEALKRLQNVRNVTCVAFGAFDRYYISWEDNDGEFHQG
jgi:hypothetical protein